MKYCRGVSALMAHLLWICIIFYAETDIGSTGWESLHILMYKKGKCNRKKSFPKDYKIPAFPETWRRVQPLQIQEVWRCTPKWTSAAMPNFLSLEARRLPYFNTVCRLAIILKLVSSISTWMPFKKYSPTTSWKHWDECTTKVLVTRICSNRDTTSESL